MNTSMWARVIKHHKIIRQETVPCTMDDPLEALGEICYRLDLQKPMWLNKNQREWEDFAQTRFTQEHFIEHIPFDSLEIEYINPDAKKQRSRDHRNEA